MRSGIIRFAFTGLQRYTNNAAWFDRKSVHAVFVFMDNGYTMWARQTIESEIFYYKPAEWFKIWFYIVNRVNHKDTKLFKRGEAIITYDEIILKCKVTKRVTERCVKWLEKETMLVSRRTTRGKKRFVVNYDVFQDPKKYKGSRGGSRGGTSRGVEGELGACSIVEECKNVKNEKKDKEKMSEQDFETFWSNYPKKADKRKCKQKFLKLDKLLLPSILSALAKQVSSHQWQDTKYIPHPSTWLNGERWDDEVAPVVHDASFYIKEMQTLGLIKFKMKYGKDLAFEYYKHSSL